MPMGEDDFDDAIIFPITDIELQDEEDEREDDSENEEEDGGNISGRYAKKKVKAFKPLMSRRQLRRAKLGYVEPGQFSKFNLNEMQQDESPQVSAESMSMSAGKTNWLRALKKIKKMEDPWAKFHIDNLPVERCIRHRYNALKQKWVQDEVQVKMEREPFNHGAMRSCYRLKKLSTFTHRRDWKHAHNYVAKMYMEEVDRDVYFEDVRLQMDAKLWGEEYNRHRPPKKVDIFQMNIIEYVEREGKPLYHLEHFIEGDYIKYNSNSGFVDEHLRLTPQAFSHFTFERSGHQLVVVDIQGVGDLWTDPQIHTSDGTGYGDGNLGTKGMALFFHSHVCNSICQCLNLSKFDLAESEVKDQSKFIQMIQHNTMTTVRGEEEAVICASPTEQVDLTTFLSRSRSRTLSTASSIISDISEQSEEDMFSQSLPDDSFFGRHRGRRGEMPMSPGTPDRVAPTDRAPGGRRIRFASESDDSSASTLTEEEERSRFQQLACADHRPSCITAEIKMRQLNNNSTGENTGGKLGDCILGMVHHDLAKYHEMGRFAVNENEVDWEAALFHEHHAADLGVTEAILTLAKLYMGMQPDILVNCTVDSTADNIEEGARYMEQAANYGDRSAMLFLAKAYQTGTNLGTSRSQSYSSSVQWYDQACRTVAENDDNGEYDGTMDTPLYTIKASMADMYLEGGYGLTRDPSYAAELYNEAAEEAMGAMKGRLANKYYAQAEEAYALVEEE